MVPVGRRPGGDHSYRSSLAAALLGTYFIYSATREEHYLTERFPDTYPRYKKATKMLIPFIL